MKKKIEKNIVQTFFFWIFNIFHFFFDDEEEDFDFERWESFFDDDDEDDFELLWDLRSSTAREEEVFLSTNENAILKGGDRKLTDFAKTNLGYTKTKGLDFVGRFNGKYVIGEAKFISAIGGNQGTAFTDIITTITSDLDGAIAVGITDGIPWIKNKSPYYKLITTTYQDHNIMSSLVLREFLYQI